MNRAVVSSTGKMNALGKQGMSIIKISSELAEVLNMSNRILVMHQGQITGRVSREGATQEKDHEYATGRIHE
jgi:ABC-type sugar transport system, ATPase component